MAAFLTTPLHAPDGSITKLSKRYVAPEVSTPGSKNKRILFNLRSAAALKLKVYSIHCPATAIFFFSSIGAEEPSNFRIKEVATGALTIILT